MNRKSVVIQVLIVAVVIVVSLPSQVAAQEVDDPTDVERFSLGIILGEPTGLSAKAWVADTIAFDAAVAWNFTSGRFHFHADYLQHFFGVFDVAPDQLPVYVGIGGNLRIRGNDTQGGEPLRSGVRVPIGVSFLASELPLDAFVEAVPGLRVFEATEFEFFWGLGARYRF